MDFVTWNAAVGETVNKRGGYGDHRARAPQSQELNALVQLIAFAPTREAVHGTDSWDSMRSSNRSGDDIGTVAVSMYYTRLKPPNKSTQRAIFPNIPPWAYHYRYHWNTKLFQSNYEWVMVCGGGLDDRGDVHGARPLSD